MDYVVVSIIGYLLGSVPVSLLVARRYGVDLYATADGNPGAWNALEQLGGRRAAPAFVGDGLKGLIAGALGWALGDFWTAWAGVAAAMAGHAFPIFAGFRGGKSVMTFVGGAVALCPQAAAVAALCGGVVTAFSTFAWGARVLVFGFPVAQLLLDDAEHVAATGILMTFIGVLFMTSAVRSRLPGARLADRRDRQPHGGQRVRER